MPSEDQPNSNLTTSQPTVDPVALPQTPISIPPPVVSTEGADTPPPPMITASDSLSAEKSPTSSPPLDISPVVVTSTSKRNVGKKAFVATILGLILLVGGITAGLYLTRQKQDIREEAFIPPGNEVTTEGGTTSSAISCLDIRVYKVEGAGTGSENWTRLSADDLKKLKAGTEIYLAAVVQSNSTEINGGFLGAKFSINGVTQPETTKIRMPSSPEGTTNTHLIYDIYTVPAGITNFNITAQIHYNSGWF